MCYGGRDNVAARTRLWCQGRGITQLWKSCALVMAAPGPNAFSDQQEPVLERALQGLEDGTLGEVGRCPLRHGEGRLAIPAQLIAM